MIALGSHQDGLGVLSRGHAVAFGSLGGTDFFREILELDGALTDWLGSSPLRPEAKLFLLISANGSVTIKEAMHSSTLSNRAFYQMIDRLKKDGKIEVVEDNEDGRVRRIILNEALTDVPSSVTDKLFNARLFDGKFRSLHTKANHEMASIAA